MKTAVTWIPIRQPPTGVHVHDFDHNPEHPDTPPEIRDKKQSCKDILDGAVWKQNGNVGILLGITERTWRKDSISKISLSFTQPAKGSGNVSIQISADSVQWPDQFIVSSRKYSDSILDWSREVLMAFSEIGIHISEQNLGFDA